MCYIDFILINEVTFWISNISLLASCPRAEKAELVFTHLRGILNSPEQIMRLSVVTTCFKTMYWKSFLK